MRMGSRVITVAAGLCVATLLAAPAGVRDRLDDSRCGGDHEPLIRAVSAALLNGTV